jgi:Ca2+-binding EF-hand superfamily protein
MRRIFGFSLFMVLAFSLTDSSVADAQGKKKNNNNKRPQQQLPDLEPKDVFERLDVNKNGLLNFGEFKAFIGIPHGKNGIAGAPKDELDRAAIFKKADANDDKTLTLEEFTTLDNGEGKARDKGDKGDKKKEKN